MSQVSAGSRSRPGLSNHKPQEAQGVPDGATSNSTSKATGLQDGRRQEGGGDAKGQLTIRTGAPSLQQDAQPSRQALLEQPTKPSNTEAEEEEEPEDQLQLLLTELGRIEGQQETLRHAVSHNKAIVVHPRQEWLDDSEASDVDTPKVPTPKLLVPSGGLTGFGVAPDLLQLDFSTPEEAPEEFRAIPYFDVPREIKPGLSGSFGLCDPASKEMHHYLERLEEQQRQVLEMISGKKAELLAMYASSSKSAMAQPFNSPVKGPQLSDTMRAKAKSRFGPPQQANGRSEVPSPAITTARKIQLAGSELAPRVQDKVFTGKFKKPKEKKEKLVEGASIKAPIKRAAVQADEDARKDEQEWRDQMAAPMVGWTPSTFGQRPQSAAPARAEPLPRGRPLPEAHQAEAPQSAEALPSRPKSVAAKAKESKFMAGAHGQISTLGANIDGDEDPSTTDSQPGTAVIHRTPRDSETGNPLNYSFSMAGTEGNTFGRPGTSGDTDKFDIGKSGKKSGIIRRLSKMLSGRKSPAADDAAKYASNT